MTYNFDMKKVTTREFVRKFGSLKGETFIVMDRKKPIGTYTPYDEKAKRMTNSEERMTNVTTPVHQSVQIPTKTESRAEDFPPIPDMWHKEEEEEEKWIKCEVCRSSRAEKTFYDSGGAGEVEICRQCARMKYAGSMRTFDGYWRKLQDTNVY